MISTSPALLHSNVQSSTRRRALIQPSAIRKRGLEPMLDTDELHRNQTPDAPKSGRIQRVKQVARPKAKGLKQKGGTKAQQTGAAMTLLVDKAASENNRNTPLFETTASKDLQQPLKSVKSTVETPSKLTEKTTNELVKRTDKKQTAGDISGQENIMDGKDATHKKPTPTSATLTTSTAPFQPRRRPKIILDLGPEPVYDALN
jgi:hypothetical protein